MEVRRGFLSSRRHYIIIILSVCGKTHVYCSHYTLRRCTCGTLSSSSSLLLLFLLYTHTFGSRRSNGNYRRRFDIRLTGVCQSHPKTVSVVEPYLMQSITVIPKNTAKSQRNRWKRTESGRYIHEHRHKHRYIIIYYYASAFCLLQQTIK